MASANKNVTESNSAGRLALLNWASVAVGKGALSVGIKTDKGVVIAADKTPPSRLYDVQSIRCVEVIDEHVGMVFSGLHPDYRILALAAQKAANVYRLKTRELQPVEEVVKDICTIMHEHTQSDDIRPFGVSLLIGGWSDGIPQLYEVDPSGTFTAWQATALGKNADLVKNFLMESHKKEAYLQESVHTAFRALKVGGCNLVAKHIDLGICDEQGFRRLDQNSIEEYMKSFTN